MNLFYKICKYDYNDPNYVNEWMEIDEYVVQNGSTDFDNYLFWEEQMLNLYLGFLKFFGDNGEVLMVLAGKFQRDWRSLKGFSVQSAGGVFDSW